MHFCVIKPEACRLLQLAAHLMAQASGGDWAKAKYK